MKIVSRGEYQQYIFNQLLFVEYYLVRKYLFYRNASMTKEEKKRLIVALMEIIFSRWNEPNAGLWHDPFLLS